ncbi:MAG: hypothetical protein LBD71_05045 [Treponema sp.]|jgi:hypothetical protein|nr:hypothetical protein [Treponema sp.]
MGTVEGLQSELDACISNINSAGLGSLDSGNIEKLEKLSGEAAGLGMSQGKKLIDNLVTVLKSFKDGSAKEDSVQIRLTAMDFYIKKIQDGSTEDL